MNVDGGPWTCFHCGETFTSVGCARLHFGPSEDSTAACLIKAGAERSILKALRDAEQSEAKAWHLLHDDCLDFARAYSAQCSRHQQALISAEELGYERGLDDGRAGATEVAAALRDLLSSCTGIPVGQSDGDTVMVAGPSSSALKRARDALANQPAPAP